MDRFQNFVFEYAHRGYRYTFLIPSCSEEDAKEQAKAMASAVFVGPDSGRWPARAAKR